MTDEQKDILEILNFLKDNMASKDDLKDLATKDDIFRLDQKIDDVDSRTDSRIHALEVRLSSQIALAKNDMVEHVDGFIALYQKHEIELAAVISRQNRLEEKIDKVMKHLNLQTT